MTLYTMMGKDIENIIGYIDNLGNAVRNGISNLNDINLNIDITESDGETDWEIKLNTIKMYYESLSSEVSKIKTIKERMAGGENFNNSIGSPWHEIEILDKVAKLSISVAEENTSDGVFMGDEGEMTLYFHMIINTTTDAKWALTYYHDYLQRGYDTIFNNNTPSVTFTNGLNNEQTDGNIQQTTNNVHIKTKSIDPY